MTLSNPFIIMFCFLLLWCIKYKNTVIICRCNLPLNGLFRSPSSPPSSQMHVVLLIVDAPYICIFRSSIGWAASWFRWSFDELLTLLPVTHTIPAQSSIISVCCGKALPWRSTSFLCSWTHRWFWNTGERGWRSPLYRWRWYEPREGCLFDWSKYCHGF